MAISNFFAIHNSVTGVDVSTLGNITLNNVTANSNVNGRGAYLDNSAGTGTVAVTAPVGSEMSFNLNGMSGIEIHTSGTVTVSNVMAAQNTGNGICIDNRYGTTPKAVTITNIAENTGNDQNGLECGQKVQ